MMNDDVDVNMDMGWVMLTKPVVNPIRSLPSSMGELDEVDDGVQGGSILIEPSSTNITKRSLSTSPSKPITILDEHDS